MEKNPLLDSAVMAAIEASKEILEVYGESFAVEQKEDHSPLTEADKRAHLKILEYLVPTGIPVLSEEGKQLPVKERQSWNRFWMVDPLDGTKEFVKRNGEFTVNIALIDNGVPVMGVIHVPVTDILYVGVQGTGAYKLENAGTFSKKPSYEWLAMAKPLPIDNPNRPYTVVASRSHMSPETEAFIGEREKEHGSVEITSIGSSLKICLVAEGEADVYPRYAPTMEWDTAAGHAIALAAGKDIIDYSTGQRMQYNKENLLNNWFTVE
jgi:3'(2'), 5'-bisphosphate nucleotidase